MRERTENIQLADCMGNLHEYQTTLFSAREASRIGLILAKVIAGPFSTFLSSADLDKELDLGPVFADLPQRVMSAGGFDLFLDILKLTKRSDEGLEGGLKWATLAKEYEMDRAYSGNLVEMGRAMKWVIWVNFVPFSPDGSRSWSNLLSGFTGLQMNADS